MAVWPSRGDAVAQDSPILCRWRVEDDIKIQSFAEPETVYVGRGRKEDYGTDFKIS